MAARKPTPAPALPDELVEEILLRMPPDEPVGLVRAAVACKGWCRLVSSSGFRRRFRERHRRKSPPMLGALCNLTGDDGARIVRFVSATSSSLMMRAERRSWRAVDSHHGRVLLQRRPSSSFAVWDPLADQLQKLPPLPRLAWWSSWNATVVCAVAGDCDHLDCPFLVVFLGSDYRERKLFAYLYSSIADAWSTEPTTYAPCHGCLWAQSRVLHLSNALYFVVTHPVVILRYDLVTRELTAIEPPPVLHGYISLATMKDGALGCTVEIGFRLYLWSRREGEITGWVQTRAIEIRNLVPAYQSISLCLRASGEIYIKMDGRVFTIDVELGQVRLVEGLLHYSFDSAADSIVPYKSFYTPVLEVDSARVDPGAGDGHERAQDTSD